jgi:hypothetical protein
MAAAVILRIEKVARVAAMALCASALAGCGTNIETTPGTGGGGGSCASACEPSIEGWTKAGSLLTARRDHQTFVVETPAGAFLYVAGGAGDASWASSLLDVERAEIHDDGTLGPFSVVAMLPGPTTQGSVAQIGRTVILVGGHDTISLGTTYVGQVADDGGIAFTAGPPLGLERHRHAAFARDGFVYALGGVHHHYDDQMINTVSELTDTVERAPFDGATLHPFAPAPPLPAPLADHAVALAGDAVYLLGGSLESSPYVVSDVLRAPILAGGDLGAFAWAGAFVSGHERMAAFALSGWVFALGGHSFGDHVMRAPMHADGTLGAFKQLADLPEAREVPQAPVYKGFVFVAGGARPDDSTPLGDVLVAKIVTP